MPNSARNAKNSKGVGAAGFLMVVAGLMILLGVVFQLAELGYGQFVPGEGWLVSLIANQLWSFVLMHMNIPALHVVLDYWPLALVGMGCATLLAMKGNAGLRTSSVRSGSRYGQ
ncbi:MAG TPA: hypothetical protein VJR23_19520 [Candidatus Acidoferrales bacterium]|nr:hypothetical protein [Candidatus Acidoferrales bacterium]